MTDFDLDLHNTLASMSAIADKLYDQRVKATIEWHRRRAWRRDGPQNVTIKVPLDWGDGVDEDDMNSCNVPLASFVRGLTAALESIPEEYRTTARYEADSDYEGWTSLGGGGVTYTRMETPEEVSARLAEYDQRVANDVRKEMASELALYRQLRAKYEGR